MFDIFIAESNLSGGQMNVASDVEHDHDVVCSI